MGDVLAGVESKPSQNNFLFNFSQTIMILIAINKFSILNKRVKKSKYIRSTNYSSKEESFVLVFVFIWYL